jgi:hypothetical protein
MRPALAMLAAVLALPAVAAANNPPIADAGEDQTVLVFELIELQGSATDPDGDPILGWLWSVESSPVGSQPNLSDPQRPDPSFFADVEGDYVLALIASDGMDWSAPDTVTIHILPWNEYPVAHIEIVGPTYGSAPFTVQLDGTQSWDPEGGELNYGWNLGDGEWIYEPTPLHTYVSPGVYVVTLVVEDDWPQHSFPATVEIPVYAPSGNQAPITDAGEDRNAPVGEAIGLQGSAADPDGDPILDWLWSVESSPADGNPCLSDPEQPDPTFMSDLEGTYVLGLIAGDGTDWGEPDTVTIAVGEPDGVPCPWDLDGDGGVGLSDFLLLIDSFGPCEDCPADFDGDGCVGILDLLAMLWNFGLCPGSGCPWDVNGDEAVGLADLWQVLGNLGPCDGCPEDVNGNGVVDLEDAIAVVVHFGPCP